MNASQYTDKIFRFYMSVVLTSVRLFQSAILTEGPAMMAMWSKAPPLSARSLSPLSGLDTRSGHVRKLPVTLGIGGGFRRVLRFPPLVAN